MKKLWMTWGRETISGPQYILTTLLYELDSIFNPHEDQTPCRIDLFSLACVFHVYHLLLILFSIVQLLLLSSWMS